MGCVPRTHSSHSMFWGTHGTGHAVFVHTRLMLARSHPIPKVGTDFSIVLHFRPLFLNPFTLKACPRVFIGYLGVSLWKCRGQFQPVGLFENVLCYDVVGTVLCFASF